MPRGPEPLPDLPRLRASARRLRHDLGKAVRFSAPGRREESEEELRGRLRADLLRTRSGPSGVMSAPRVFDAWLAAEGEGFSAIPALARRVAAISASIEEIRDLLRRLDDVSRDELVRLDEAALRVAEECRALSHAAAEMKE